MKDSLGADLTDRELVLRLGDRDDRALGVLYDRYAASLYGLARAIVADLADAEEVVEDTFIKLWDDPQSYSAARGSLGAFLTIVARSKALDKVRAGRRRAAATARAAESAEDGLATPVARVGVPPLRGAEQAEIADAVRRAMDSLPEPQRRALELAYFGGYSQREIASRLSEPLGTVKTRIRTGMLSLREAMAPFKNEVER